MARRRILSLVAALAISLAVAAPASAVKPVRGCTDSFDLWSIVGFRAYMNSAEFYLSLPPEGQALAPDILASINSDTWLAATDGIDKNGDGYLCLKQGPVNSGHLFGWIFNAVDNTANR